MLRAGTALAGEREAKLSMFYVAYPWWLLALPLPLLCWYLARRRLREHGPALLHPHAALLASLGGERRLARAPWPWLLGCALLIAALSRPMWLDMNDPANHNGRDFMLALDVSDSMRAQDYVFDGKAATRLEVVKQHVDALLAGRRGDRVGVIVFGDDAYTLVPPTADLALARRLVEDVSYGMAGERTALGAAVALAAQRLKDRPAAGRVLILFTDGAQTAGNVTPKAALAAARRHGLRIYAIGVGSGARVVAFPGALNDPVVTNAPLDETVLREFAEATGGRYFRAADDGALEQVLTQIAALETVPLRGLPAPQGEEWYWAPLALGLALLAFAQVGARRGVLP